MPSCQARSRRGSGRRRGRRRRAAPRARRRRAATGWPTDTRAPLARAVSRSVSDVDSSRMVGSGTHHSYRIGGNRRGVVRRFVSFLSHDEMCDLWRRDSSPSEWSWASRTATEECACARERRGLHRGGDRPDQDECRVRGAGGRCRRAGAKDMREGKYRRDPVVVKRESCRDSSTFRRSGLQNRKCPSRSRTE